MKEDLLYKIFADHLEKQAHGKALGVKEQAHQHPFPEQSHTKGSQDVLVRSVTNTYFTHLKSYGHVPFEMIKVVMDDLEQEVLEMYRKKTYGHFNLKSYWKQTKTKRK